MVLGFSLRLKDLLGPVTRVKKKKRSAGFRVRALVAGEAEALVKVEQERLVRHSKLN